MAEKWHGHVIKLKDQIADLKGQIAELRKTIVIIGGAVEEQRTILEQRTSALRQSLETSNVDNQPLYQLPSVVKILDNPEVGAILVGSDGRYLLFNAVAQDILGSSLNNVNQDSSAQYGLFLPDKVTRYTADSLPWQQCARGARTQEVVIFVRRSDITDGIWIRTISMPVTSDEGESNGSVAFLLDTTEQVVVEEQIKELLRTLEDQLGSVETAQELLLQVMKKLAITEVSAKITSSSTEEVKNHAPPKSPSNLVVQPLSVERSQAEGGEGKPASFGALQPEGGHNPAAETVAKGGPKTAVTDVPAVTATAPDKADPATPADGADEQAPEAPDKHSGEPQAEKEVQLSHGEPEAQPVERDAASSESQLPPKNGHPESSSTAAKTMQIKSKRSKESHFRLPSMTRPIQANAPASKAQDERSSEDDQEKGESSPEPAFAAFEDIPSPTLNGSGESEAEPDANVIFEQSITRENRVLTNLALIVDDIPVNQKLLCLQLMRYGFEVQTANNGKEAVDSIVKNDFDIVFMDLDMPIMDGVQATVAIRKIEAVTMKHVPIVAMTSYKRDVDRKRCLKAGMDDYLTKGANRQQLLEVIGKFVKPVVDTDAELAKLEERQGPAKQSDTTADIMRLKDLHGDAHMREVSRLFYSSVSTFVDCLQLAIDEKNTHAVIHFIHCIKGPAASLGLTELMAILEEANTAADNDDWTRVCFHFMKLRANYIDVVGRLKEIFGAEHLANVPVG